MNKQTILEPCEFQKKLETMCIDVYPTDGVQWIINNFKDEWYYIEVVLYDGPSQISTNNRKKVYGMSEAYNEYRKVRKMELKRLYGNDVF